jgi:hypothetical protein
MHRSGTSMITNLLMELGVQFNITETLFLKDQWNVKGYFEQNEIIDVNSQIIIGFDRTKNKLSEWFSQTIYATMPNPKTFNKRARGQKRQILSIEKEYAMAMAKDPRFCLTLPYWQDLINIEKYVICLRDPVECVLSLKRKQHFPLPLGFRFWHYHIHNLLLWLPKEKVIFIDFNKLSGENYQEELKQIRTFFNLNLDTDKVITNYKKVFDKNLIYCKNICNIKLPLRVRDLWDKLIEEKRVKPT